MNIKKKNLQSSIKTLSGKLEMFMFLSSYLKQFKIQTCTKTLLRPKVHVA